MATPNIGSRRIPSRVSFPWTDDMLWRRFPPLLVLTLVFALVFANYTIALSHQYGVPLTTAVHGAARDTVLSAIDGSLQLYDPYRPRLARMEPENTPDFTALGFDRVEDVLRGGHAMQLRAYENARIIRSTFSFRYQPHDEPHLQLLAQRYGLLDIVRSAHTEFEGMVKLRHWARSQFARDDYQPLMTRFDALEILERGYRDHGEAYTPQKFYDPCKFFPLLLSQALLSVGYQARLMSVNHGMVEIWSNQFRKWVLFDAELDQHFERDGVPMNMVDLGREYAAFGPASPHVRIVRSARLAGAENPTRVHLKLEAMTPPMVLPWFKGAVVLVERRNDWITNEYFPGHPSRGERNSLVFCPSGQDCPAFENRLRPQTTRESDFNWSLNETEILAGRTPSDSALSLGFRTVTPNFDHFEIVQDTSPLVTKSATFTWQLHSGTNTLEVRSVNANGIRGIPSTVSVQLQ
jgi:hypothetical protein